MKQGPSPRQPSDIADQATEAAVRITLVALLAALCFQIVLPFALPVVWAAIIAIAVYPMFQRASRRLGDRPRLTATLFAVAGSLLVLGPLGWLSALLAENAQSVGRDLQDGRLLIPPLPDAVAGWPLVGPQIATVWESARENIQDAALQMRAQIQSLGAWLLSAAAAFAAAVFQFVIAIIIAAVLMVSAGAGRRATVLVARRVAGERAEAFVTLTEATVRGVAIGAIGVALLQAVLAGAGFAVAGLPLPGILAALVFILSALGIGPAIVIIPTIIYAFSEMDTLSAVLFTAYILPVMLMDNILKPIVMARGVNVPALVIFIGVLGGTLAFGVLGLFIGPVILAIGYNVFTDWVKSGETETPEQTIARLVETSRDMRARADHAAAYAELKKAQALAKQNDHFLYLTDIYLELGNLAMDADAAAGSSIAARCVDAASQLIATHDFTDRRAALAALRDRGSG